MRKIIFLFLLFFYLLHPDISANPANKSSAISNTLILFHDTSVVLGKVKRLADRDSIMKYLPTYIPEYDILYFNENTVLPALTQYHTIFLIETSFDNGGALCLGANARTTIKNWLNSGTPGHKNNLISIGADQGYNYDRTDSPHRDTSFSRSYCGFIFKVDRVHPSATTVTGTAGPDVGIIRPIAPPFDGAYYPDGCSRTENAYPLYKYGNQTAIDTLAGISNVKINYVAITLFQDPRYFVSGSIRGWIRALIVYINSWGPGGISGTGEFANEYSLSQNYPNPFNPTTKISFAMPTKGFVSLKVYDISGNEVMTLVNKNIPAGRHSVDFNGELLSSGVYFYKLESADFVETKKMMLIK